MNRLLLRNFRLIYRLDRWIRRHFTKAGMVVLGALIAAGVFGIDTRQTLAYQIFTLAAALLLIAMPFAWLFRIRYSARRELPTFGTLGEPLYYRLELTNHTAKLQRGLSVHDLLEQSLPGAQAFLAARASEDRRLNWFDRRVGYPRWLAMVYKQRGGETEEHSLPPLPPHGTVNLRLCLQPRRRGYVYFSDVCLARPDPLGLFRALRYQPCPGRVLILPKLHNVPHLNLPGRRKYQRGGVNLAMSVGDAVEFMALREYRPGDAPRHIHWKSWAKLGKPIVKEFQDEFFVRRALILDTFMQPAHSEAQFEDAVSLAASFACNMFSQDALLDFLFVGEKAHSFTSGRGLGHLEQLLEILACVESCRDKPFGVLEGLVAAHAHALSGAICVLLDWDEPRRRVLEMLKSLRVPAMVWLVTDRPEDFPLDDIRQSVYQAQVFKTGELAEGLAKLRGP